MQKQFVIQNNICTFASVKQKTHTPAGERKSINLKKNKSMKKLLFTLIGLFMMCATATFAGNEKTIKVTQLPLTSQQFINRHFAKSKVALAKMESGIFTKSYEVIFANGNKVDFDSKGNWEEIDCKASSVPSTVVPSRITEYVKAHYPGTKIIKIEKDSKGYELKLSSRMELKFDQNFNLTDIDN